MENVKIIRRRTGKIILRLLPSGVIQVTAPLSLSQKAIAAFLEENRQWIESKRKTLPVMSACTYESGEMHWYLGQSYVLEILPSASYRYAIEENCIRLWMKPEANREVFFVAVMKKELTRLLETLCIHWCSVIGCRKPSISIRRMRTRWGSCSYKTGRIRFSLDLISKPLPHIELVVVHELLHLLEPSHNRHFYAFMDRYLPNHQLLRKELPQLPKEFY